jgi:hypothetical protein
MRRLCRQELLGLLRRKRHRRILHSAKWRFLPPPGWSGRPGCRPPSPSRNPGAIPRHRSFYPRQGGPFFLCHQGACRRPSLRLAKEHRIPTSHSTAAPVSRKNPSLEPLPPKDLRARLSPLLFCGPPRCARWKGPPPNRTHQAHPKPRPRTHWPQARFPALRRSQRPRRLTWQGGRNFPPRPRRNPRDQRLRLSPPVV